MNWLRTIGGNCLAIMLHGSPLGRMKLLITYLRVAIKAKLLVDLLKMKIHEETVFSQTICFETYATFLILFEEIYLTSVYYFQARNSTPLIIDAGANIGAAVAYFKTIYPDSAIVAFEPDPANYQFLCRNIERNRWTKVDAHNVALHEREQIMQFFDYNDNPGALSNGFWQPACTGPAKKILMVPAVPLSRHITGYVDMLKMDIEGSEHDVLRELEESGKLGEIGRITMEYHHHIQPHDDRLGHILCALEIAGFGYHLRAPLALPFPEAATQNFILRAYH